jgi:hypothetical protein
MPVISEDRDAPVPVAIGTLDLIARTAQILNPVTQVISEMWNLQKTNPDE